MKQNEFKFEDTSAKVLKEFSKEVEKLMEKALLHVESEAKLNASGRVDTGQLRNSYNHSQEYLFGEYIGRVGTRVDYFIYNELGTGEYAENGKGRKGGWVFQFPNGDWIKTKGLKPHPMLRPAFRNNKKYIEETFAKGLKVKFNFK